MKTSTTKNIITIDVNTPSGVKKFSFFKNTSYPLKILNGQSYPLYANISSPQIIFDIGANIGAASFYFAENYPKATIFAFEPCSTINSILKKNLEYFQNIFIVKKAISNKNIEKTKLYIDTNNYDGSSLFDEFFLTNDLDKDNYEMVETINCDFFCKKNKIKKIDILKIDAEGSEINIIESLSDYLINISIIYIECHSKKNLKSIRDTLAKTHLCIKNFDKKKFINESIFINNKIRNS